MRYTIYFFFLLLIFSSCIKIELSEKQAFIPHEKWHYSFVPKLSFSISDTIRQHKIFIIIKHFNAYEYQNLWLRIGIQAPEDSLHFMKVNIPLSDNERGWLGSGFSNIYERRFLWTSLRFKKAGEYLFDLHQIMRNDPLENIIAVGIRIEK